LRTQCTGKWLSVSAERGFWRRLRSYPCFAMLKLVLSFSPLMESSMNSPPKGMSYFSINNTLKNVSIVCITLNNVVCVTVHRITLQYIGFIFRMNPLLAQWYVESKQICLNYVQHYTWFVYIRTLLNFTYSQRSGWNPNKYVWISYNTMYDALYAP